jgi:rhodanese-related sulfurtransferase
MDYTIVDVRTTAEFQGGHVAGSINIPLNEVVDRADEIMKLKTPVVFCCASGGRSGQATAYFRAQGLECENGGGWMEVNMRMAH